MSTLQNSDAAAEAVEDELFMHYLDHVFYTQYPFHQSRRGQGRAWMYSILRAHPATYFATLALSEHERLAQNHAGDFDTGLAKIRAKHGYFDKATQEMQRFVSGSYSWPVDKQEPNILIGLMSLLQLLYCEVGIQSTNICGLWMTANLRTLAIQWMFRKLARSSSQSQLSYSHARRNTITSQKQGHVSRHKFWSPHEGQ